MDSVIHTEVWQSLASLAPIERLYDRPAPELDPLLAPPPFDRVWQIKRGLGPILHSVLSGDTRWPCSRGGGPCLTRKFCPFFLGVYFESLEDEIPLFYPRNNVRLVQGRQDVLE